MKYITEVKQMPLSTCQTYNPKYREMTIKQIQKEINPTVNWIPYGYSMGLFHRDTATVYHYGRIKRG